MKKIQFILALIILVLGGCSKVDLEEIPSETPVFTVNAVLDGEDLRINAGDDDFYMFTEYDLDNFEVYSMTGRFAKDANCLIDCEESLSFTLRNNNLFGGTFDIDSVISLNTNLPFYSDSNIVVVNGHNYTFSSTYADSLGVTFLGDTSWEIFGSQLLDTIAMDTGGMVNFSYFGAQDMNIRLELKNANGTGLNSYFETQLKNGTEDFCDIDIFATFNQFDSSYILNLSNVQSYSSISWNGNQMDSFNLPLLQTSQQVITLEAIENTLNCDVGLGIYAQVDSNGQFNDLSALVYPKIMVEVEDDSMIMVGNEEQYSAVTIEYRDETGVYSSANWSNSNSTFTVLKIEDYEDNENGEKTKRLTIAYENCVLAKEGGGDPKIISGTAEIGIAYPD